MANNVQFKKKDNGLNLKFFESSETLQLFDTIRLWIQKNCKKVCFSNFINASIHNDLYLHIFDDDLIFSNCRLL